jgi:hypothetical protein
MKLILNHDEFKKGETLRLAYNCVNQGEFLWETVDKIDCIYPHFKGEKRIVGRFQYPNEEWSEIGDYLYTFNYMVCRGSGAEPLWILDDYETAKDIQWNQDYEYQFELRNKKKTKEQKK